MATHKLDEARESASARLKRNLALAGKARVAAWSSLALAVIAGALLGLQGLSMWLESTRDEQSPSEMTPRAQQIEALKRSGQGMGIALIGLAGITSVLAAIALGRRWARLATESISGSDVENRQLLQHVRDSKLDFALFLRGFEAEGKSIASIFTIPLPNARVVKLTRWIESEVVDELERNELPTFCIANPSDKFLLPGAVRVVAEQGKWLDEVRELAIESKLVVVHVSAMSQGLRDELEMLANEDVQSKCVLIVGRKRDQRDSVIQRFPNVVPGIPTSRFNQSASGPILGRLRFRRGMREACSAAL